MKRSTKQKTPRGWKRKRGRVLEKRLRQRDLRLKSAPEKERYARLVNNILRPALLAETARRLGSPAVAPRDFFCGCPPCAKDGLPVCEGLKPGCRFRGRWTKERAAAAETAKILNEYEYQWEIVSMHYSGDRISAKLATALDRAEQGDD